MPADGKDRAPGSASGSNPAPPDDAWASGSHPGFFTRIAPLPLSAIATQLDTIIPPEFATRVEAMHVHDVQALDGAGPKHLSFIDNRRYLDQLASTRAGACLVAPALVSRLPAHTVPLVTPTPYHGFARALALFYPDSLQSQVLQASTTAIASSARIETGAVIEHGALIGPEARIGRGTRIAAGAVIGRRVTIGRDSYVGPGASVLHSLIGDRVILHAGVRLGNDGFGFAMGPEGHLKVPQVGRVIVQDDVEIGANSTIDRGALKDTVIGEGTKIDNLVQIGHNTVIGRHCIIVSQVGIAGSTVLEDFVVVGGQAGIIGHVTIGRGTQIAAASRVMGSLPAGARVGGYPAVSQRNWARQAITLRKLAERYERVRDPDGEDGEE